MYFKLNSSYAKRIPTQSTLGMSKHYGSYPKYRTTMSASLYSDSSNSIVFTRYIASTNPVGTWKYYNQKYYDINSSKYLNEIIEALKPYTKKYPVYDKSTYSCYVDSTLKSIIDQYDTISICGVVADCCILSTILSLIDTGKQIVYLNDAIGEYGKGSKQAVDTIVKNMSIHVKSLSVKEYLNTI